MSKFVYGTELSLSIEKIIATAQERLYLLAPSIHFPARLKEELRRKMVQDGLQIIVVFGKAGKDITKSISSDELNFLKDFPNVVICYEEKLKANYYANENTLLFTSVSLDDYQNSTTIQAGVMDTAKGMFKQLAGSITNTITETEKSSWDIATEYFADVVLKSRELFRKTPQYDKGFLNLNKKYNRSIVEVNTLDAFMALMTPVAVEAPLTEHAAGEVKPEPAPETMAEEKPLFTTEYRSEATAKPEPQPVQRVAAVSEAAAKTEEEFQPGFCIRTGAALFFDPRNPMTPHAMAEWKKEGDREFPENYCHFSGEPSYGQTSINRPILQKHLKKAQGYL